MYKNKNDDAYLLQIGHGEIFSYKKNASVNELIEFHAESTPDAVAIRFNDFSINYAQLNRKINQLAHFLIKQGLNAEEKVAVYFMPSLEMIISILAILKLGCCYIPLDIHYPIDRLTFILNDCSVAYLLTQAALASTFTKKNIKTIVIDENTEVINPQEDLFVSTNTTNALAYIIYTSGSTGVPNGVKIHWQAINNHMAWMKEEFQFTNKDKILLKTPLSFDPSVWELLLPFYVGCELIIALFGANIDPSLLITTLQKQKVTTLQVVPSLLKELLKSKQLRNCNSLRHLFCGGESLTTEIKKLFFQELTCPLHNLYGPTEATIDITSHTVANTAYGITKNIIGKPIYNTSLYIVNKNKELAGIGEEGELYIGSDSLSSGYHNRDSLTQERFIKNPYEPQKYPKIYKTGDIVRWLDNGELEYLGRNNEQLKINGVRIEPNELMSVILKQPSVSEGIIVKKTDARGYDSLACYLVPKADCELNIAQVKASLQSQFPSYMLPKAFVLLKKIPLTLNGKVDNTALPDPNFNIDFNIINIATSIKEEKQLIIIWQTILGISIISLEDNFFDIGGTSFLAVNLLINIEEEMGVKLSIRDIFTYPTLKEQANFIQSLRNQTFIKPKSFSIPSPIITLQTQGNQSPLFLIHPIGGTIFWYSWLAKLLKKVRPIYGIQDPSIELEKPIFESIEEMASFYLNHIKKIQPNGNYLIGGASFGTTVAIEIARMLHQTGDKVTSIISLDGWGIYPSTLHDDTYFRRSMERQHQELRAKFNKQGVPQPEKLFNIQWQRLNLLWKYQIKKIVTPMALFKSREILPIFNEVDAPMNHWEKFSDPEKISCYLAPGNHETMFQKPYVEILATLMDEYFEKN
ncbi:MAG TPA: amino acid adenylation domain-containing protein [Candidatus Aquirickettsiella sp.]|jgi:amino acid adenylation domain-containing protein